MSKNKAVHERLDSLLAAVGGHSFEDVPVGEATYPLRPVTILEIIRICKRFPALLELFEGEDAAEGEDKDEKTQEGKTIAEVIVDAGPEAVAALVACSAGAPGDVAVEEKIAGYPDDVLLPLVAGAVKRTLGEDGIEGFFSKVMAVMGASGLSGKAKSA